MKVFKNGIELMKKLGVELIVACGCFLIMGGLFQIDTLKPSAQTIIDRQGGCIGVVGLPEAEETLLIEEINLEVAVENYTNHPDSTEAIEMLEQAKNEYLEAKKNYEAYQQTEAYQNYLNKLACQKH